MKSKLKLISLPSARLVVAASRQSAAFLEKINRPAFCRKPLRLFCRSRKLIFVSTLLVASVGLGAFIAGCSRQPEKSGAPAASSEKTLYTCGMHPWIIQDHPGNCPICGMKLEPVHKQASNASTGAASGERKFLYYKSTMKPGETSPVPAKDSMGMDMVPVYEDQAAATASSAIAIDPATIQMMNIQTTEVARGPLRRTIRTVGTIDYNETALAEVTTKVKGWVEKLYVDATGALVHRGEPLFEIYSPELYRAEAEYLAVLNSTNDSGERSAEHPLGVLEKQPIRAEPVLGAPASPASSLRAAAADKLKFYDISDAQITDLEKNRTPKKTLPMLAPMDGFVIEKNVVQGQMVDAGMKLYQLADLGIVWIYAQIYEPDLPYIRLGQEAVVRLSSMPDREFRGRVTYVYPNVDAKTRTARVRLEFENPGYFLKPGMFVSVRIVSELKPSALLVPDSAVLRSGEKNTVFVALPGGKFDPRAVVLGPEAEQGLVEVISGLQAGERVVGSGQFLLDSESQLREAIQKMRGSVAVAPPPPAFATNETGQVSSTNAEKDGVVYVCPMPEHVSITYDHPGNCPICGMTLVPVTPAELKQLQPGGGVLYYTCPMPEHSRVHEDKPGKCPICGMTLIPVMALPDAVTNLVPPSTNLSSTNQPAAKQLYTCPMHPDVFSDKPGQCPKCGMNLVPVKQ